MNFSDLADIGSIVTAAAVIFAVFQLVAARTQRHRDFENLYVQRYWQILDRMPDRLLISELFAADPILDSLFRTRKREVDGLRHFASVSGRYPFTGRGRVKTDPIFAELFRSMTHPIGRTGIIVPTGIATDHTTQFFFKDMVETSTIAALYDFENRAPLFQDVDSRFKFCLLTIAGRMAKEEAASLAFFLHDPADISVSEFALTPDEIKLINPNTGTLPIFRTRRDAEITLRIYRRVPVLINENDPVNGNPWGVSFMQGLFNMTSDSHLFHTREQLENDGWTLKGNIFERIADGNVEKMLPLYEAKMIHQYDHRWTTYDGDEVRDALASEKMQGDFMPLPRYWVAETRVDLALGDHASRKRLLAFRDITNVTNERTAIFGVIPKAGVGHTAPLVFAAGAERLLPVFDSFAFDYIARQKVGGTRLTYMYLKQLPVVPAELLKKPVPWDTASVWDTWLALRVAELTEVSWYMALVPFLWDFNRRALLRAELDAAIFHLYGTVRTDVEYIMDTFPIVRRKDEVAHGEYRTKRLVLEAFDAMQQAMDTAIPYESPLSPPPGLGPRHPAKKVSA